MATVQVDATATSVVDTWTTSHTVSLPANIAENDLLLLLWAIAETQDGTTATPTGWTLLYGDDVGTVSISVRVRAKREN